MQRFAIRKRTVFIFLTLIGLIAYSNSLRVPFHYDDVSFLRENAVIKSCYLFFQWITSDLSRVVTGRAFLLFTFYINFLLNGFDTFGYHIVNLLVHITTAFLFYLLIATYIDNEKDDPYHVKAVLAAALFLLHPINTESVTYISSRSSELSTLFMLSSILVFFNSTRNRFYLTGYILSIIFFILGLSTKQSAIVTPFLMALFDRYFISQNVKNFAARMKYHLPFWGMVLAASFYYSGIVLHPEMFDRSWLTHILTELKVIVAYLRLLFLPFGLNIDHDIRESAALDPEAIFSMLVIAGLLFIAYFLRSKNRVLSFSLFWFFLNIAPFLTLKLSDYMAERWIYAASLGFALGLSELLIAASYSHKKIWVTAAVMIAVLFGTLTFLRNNVYKDPITLWADAARKSPEKIRPYINLCASYLERMYVDKAIEMCETAIMKGGAYDETYVNLASAYFSKGDLDKAKKILLSMNAEAGIETFHYNLAVIYAGKGEHRKAIEEYKRVLQFKPQSPSALAGIGGCYKQLSMKDKAYEYYLMAAKGTPQSGEDYLMLAESFFQLGYNKQGTESFSKALIAEPLNLRIRKTLATTYLEQKNYDEAYRHFSIMAKIAPNLAHAYKGMGSAMLAKGDLKEAKKQFIKALSLLPPDSPDRKDIVGLLEKT